MLIQPSADHTYTWANFFLADIRRRSYWVFDLEATCIDYVSERVNQHNGGRGGGVRVGGADAGDGAVAARHRCGGAAVGSLSVQFTIGDVSR
jgi:hypothetical protein